MKKYLRQDKLISWLVLKLSKCQNRYPIYDQNGWKTAILGHTYIAHIRKYLHPRAPCLSSPLQSNDVFVRGGRECNLFCYQHVILWEGIIINKFFSGSLRVWIYLQGSFDSGVRVIKTTQDPSTLSDGGDRKTSNRGQYVAKFIYM